MGRPATDALVVLVVLVAFVVIAGFLSRRRSPYDEIGAGELSFQHEDEDVEAGEIASRQAREEELRQMLQARSDRLVRAGEPPLDVDAELARLEAGGDSEIGV